MQLINGFPAYKEECKAVIRIQIWLAAACQVEKLPESVRESMHDYLYRCGK